MTPQPSLMLTTRDACARTLAVLCLLLPVLAQDATKRDPRRVAIDEQLAKEMVAFARGASSQKVHSLAREAARLVVEHYAPDSPTARRLLGQRKVRGKWEDQSDALPGDAANERSRERIEAKWQAVRGQAGALHRDLGIAMLKD